MFLRLTGSSFFPTKLSGSIKCIMAGFLLCVDDGGAYEHDVERNITSVENHMTFVCF